MCCHADSAPGPTEGELLSSFRETNLRPDKFYSYLVVLHCDQHIMHMVPKTWNLRQFEAKFIPLAAEPC